MVKMKGLPVADNSQAAPQVVETACMVGVGLVAVAEEGGGAALARPKDAVDLMVA